MVMGEVLGVERCDGYQGGVGRYAASLDRKCDSHQGGVKGIKNECHLMERCDGHGVGVRGWKGGMVIMEV